MLRRDVHAQDHNEDLVQGWRPGMGGTTAAFFRRCESPSEGTIIEARGLLSAIGEMESFPQGKPKTSCTTGEVVP